MSSSVKQQLIQDLQLAGLAPLTRKLYLACVLRFVKHTRIRPQDATEAQVADYLCALVQRGQCQGTMRPIKSALQFLFQNTLRRDWTVFKKESVACGAGVCPRSPATPSAAASSPPFATRSIGPVWA